MSAIDVKGDRRTSAAGGCSTARATAAIASIIDEQNLQSVPMERRRQGTPGR